MGEAAGPSGTLVIGGGGTVSMGAGVLGDAGASTSLAAAAAALTVGGGSGSAVLDDAGDLVDGAFGQARVTVTAGGTLTIGGTLLVGGVSPLNGGVGTMEVNGGLLTAKGVQLSPGSMLSAAVAGGIVAVGGASATQGIDIAAGASVFGAGLVSGNLADDGAVIAEVPLASLQLSGGSITGGGSLVVALASALDIFTTVHYGNPVAFSGPAAVLQLEAPAALQGAISGFGIGDAIDLPGVKFPPSATLSYDGVAGVLHFGADAFAVGTGYDAQNFALHPEPVGTGTKIVPVAPQAALRLSPDHAVFAGGALIPVHLLVNGGSIAREPARGVVEYVHVELERHDLVVAEGLRAESYLDTGNRELFTATEVTEAAAAEA